MLIVESTIGLEELSRTQLAETIAHQLLGFITDRRVDVIDFHFRLIHVVHSHRSDS